MDLLCLEDQRKAILYAPKDLLFLILEEEEAWLRIFKKLPSDYMKDFLMQMKRMGVKAENKEAIYSHAQVYVRDKVRIDHLQAALISVWNPDDLVDSTSWLKAKGFLNRPLLPLNLRASTSAEGDIYPSISDYPLGSSLDGRSLWRKLMRDPKVRNAVSRKSSKEEKRKYATKLWLRLCKKAGCPPYEEGSEVSTEDSIRTSIHNLRNAMLLAGIGEGTEQGLRLRDLWASLEECGEDLGPVGL